MGRLLLVIAALFVGGALMRPRGAVEVRPVAAVVAVEPAVSSIAYRPGEPQLAPGRATELRRAADGHFYADPQVNGLAVPMLVDTGASTVALTVSDAQRLGLAVDSTAFDVVGSGASGPVRGARVTLDSIALGSRREGPIEAVVLEGLDRSLLGQAFLGRFDQVQITGDTMTLQ